MKQYFRSLIEKIRIAYRRLRRELHHRATIQQWHKSGQSYPPPHELKLDTILKYASKHNFDTLVETGTHLGNTPWALQDDFKKIFTIEYNIDRYLNAKERFYALEHIEVIKGESSEQLAVLLKSIRCPALFWLDTHEHLEKGLTEFSIKKEINEILGTKYNHLLLIPDARLFTGDKGYPSLVEIRNYISELRPSYQFEVENDIIRSYWGNLVN